MAKTTFETALKQLETIVKEMESGDLPLEQALKKYETGIEKVRYCMEILDSTEKNYPADPESGWIRFRRCL